MASSPRGPPPPSSSSDGVGRGVIRALWMTFLVSLVVVPVGEGARVMKHFPQRRDAMRIMAVVNHQSSQWCVAAQGVSDAALQAALDWACGTGSTDGNADCTAIQESGSCYSPNTLKDHASYAFNQYFQKQNQDPTACNFGSSATVTFIDPSSATCSYPSTASGLSSPTPTSTTVNYTSTTTGTTTPTTFNSSSAGTLLSSPIGWYYYNSPFWSTLIVLFIYSRAS